MNIQSSEDGSSSEKENKNKIKNPKKNGYSIPVENIENISESEISIVKEKKSCKSFSFFIILIDLSVYLIQLLNFRYKYQSQQWGCALFKLGAKYTPSIKYNHQYYRLFTAIFLHDRISNIIPNIVSIFFLGFYIENILGSLRFSFLFLFSGFIGNLYSTVFNRSTLSVGASICSMGISGIFLINFIIKYNRSSFIKIFDLALYIFLTLVNGFNINANIEKSGHFIGFLFGIIISPIFLEDKGLSEYVGLGAIKALKIMSIAIIASIVFTCLGYLICFDIPSNIPKEIC
ncbi:MAG: rhomboid family intramembrane serine protease [archaeon]|nr:rhomboid family intramembrane serine protease [archaeon]